MRHTISEQAWRVVVCPICRNRLSRLGRGAACTVCGQEYRRTDRGQLDLRLRKIKSVHLEFQLGEKIRDAKRIIRSRLPRNPHPEVDFSTLKVPWHLSEELLSYFPRANPKGSLMLDLGCGSTIHRKICEHAGFEYVGLDYDSPEALILGDGHVLPFKDNGFQFILSVAVLEHIRYPFVMMKEVYRVLKPGGRFIGTVAFLEPFHGDSFYHHTHLGTLNSLRFAGFDVEAIAPVRGWSVLLAQATMGLFPKLPRAISRSLIFPLDKLHRFWWRLGYAMTGSKTSSEEYRLLRTAGAFSFVASKASSEKMNRR